MSNRPRMIAPGKKRTLVAVCAFLVFTLMPSTRSRSESISGSVTTLPDLTLPDVRGVAFHLCAQPAQPLLLAFLQTVPDTADTPSRSQVVFMSSMARQYVPRGVRVAIVDASVLTSDSQLARDAILNASYDWQLNFPLLLDQNGQLAHQLGVKDLPTTFLFAQDGTIVQRWQGLTRPAVLAQAIEKVTGGHGPGETNSVFP